MNNKGVSLIAIAITIIVIIIMAGIAINAGFYNITSAQKSSFMLDLDTATNALQRYNTNAQLKTTIPAGYYEGDLQWDGKSERAVNTAQIEVAGQEDTAEFIFDNLLTENLKGKIKIVNGKIYVDKNHTIEYEWATEYYKYMLSGDND